MGKGVRMAKVTMICYVLGAMSLLGMGYYLAAHFRPGIYPPKRVLRKRVLSLGALGAGLLLAATLLSAAVK